MRVTRGLVVGVRDSDFPLYGMGATGGREHRTFSEIVQSPLYPAAWPPAHTCAYIRAHTHTHTRTYNTHGAYPRMVPSGARALPSIFPLAF